MFLKFAIFIFLISSLSAAFANEESVDAICQKIVKKAIVEKEAKKTKVKKDQVKLSEFLLRGNGSILYLYSGFVSGPSTGDNTHWEVVASFNFDKRTCAVVASDRYWAH